MNPVAIAEHFCELLPFREQLSRELAGSSAAISPRRLFVLSMLFDLEKATKAPIRTAARDEAVQAYLRPRLGEELARSIRGLQHSPNLGRVISGLQERGFIARVNPPPGAHPSYHLTQLTRLYLYDYRCRARSAREQAAAGTATEHRVA